LQGAQPVAATVELAIVAAADLSSCGQPLPQPIGSTVAGMQISVTSQQNGERFGIASGGDAL
jgi:hypothetical protein